MNDNRRRITNYIEQGSISKTDIPKALALAQLTPSPNQWYNFVSKLSYWLSAIAFSCAVIFFFAYNWSDMGRYAKFGVLQVLIVLCIALYCLLPNKPQLSKILLFTASLLIGALLALIGQVYQSGADPWFLFALWALLIIPWLLISKLAALYLFWISLIGVSLGLYLDGVGLYGFVMWSFFALSSLSLIIWQLSSRRFVWLKQPWATRVLVLVSLSNINQLLWEQVFLPQSLSATPWIVWAAWSVCCFYYYRYREPDLLVLTALALSVIVVVDMHLVEYVLESEGGMLLITVLTIAMGSYASHWLRSLAKQLAQQETSDSSLAKLQKADSTLQDSVSIEQQSQGDSWKQ